ncbi:hypothetical protein SAMN05443545_103144 [Aidingimonas halophila]|uniref:Uncharacterized protein n=2 Tax=Aidingimonas halophila TaxID=574349 RepID=A0A1H2XAW8_9GAMM|nr:hypothetical protein SAMN05443545_103144 [Aidingimonas halophila]
MDILYTSRRSMPDWWEFLNAIGQWAYARVGLYVCVVCPDDVFSSFAVASSLLEKSHQNDKDILDELESKPNVLLSEDGLNAVRAIYLGLEEINGDYLCKFQRTSLTQYVPPSRLDGMVIPKTSRAGDWLKKIERKERVSQHQLNVASTRIIGNRTALMEAARLEVFSVDFCGSLLSRSLGDILKVEGTKNLPRHTEAIKLLSSRTQGTVQSEFEIWSGDIPPQEPSPQQSVVCCLGANDVNLAYKAATFTEQLTGRMGQLGWYPLIIDGECPDEEFSELLERKPADVEISALAFQGR